MKQASFIITICLAAVCFSCSKADPELEREFQRFASQIDLSQKNQFKESDLCKDGVLSKTTIETYVDGALSVVSEVADFEDDRFDLEKDHGVIRTQSWGTSNGSWLYSHNYLMMVFQDGIACCFEVVSVTNGTLLLKAEKPSKTGMGTIPYYMDMSGTHQFIVREYGL